MAQLSSELSVLQSSFELVQDTVQLPTIHIWHQQLRQVMSHALLQELKALPPVKLCPALSKSAARLPVQADRLSEPSHTSKLPEPDQASKLPGPSQATPTQLYQSVDGSMLRHQDSPATSSALPEQDTQPASVNLPSEAPASSLPNQASSHSHQSLPSQATVSAHQHLPTLARPSQQATARHLPNQASSPRGGFLTACLAELLRLSEPHSSQY